MMGKMDLCLSIYRHKSVIIRIQKPLISEFVGKLIGKGSNVEKIGGNVEKDWKRKEQRERRALVITKRGDG